MLGRFADHFSASLVSFDVVLPDKTVQHFGPARPAFGAISEIKEDCVRSEVSTKVRSETRISRVISISMGICYDRSNCAVMKDFHPLVAAWRFIQPLLFGQVHTNKRAIGAHYDIDPTFFL